MAKITVAEPKPKLIWPAQPIPHKLYADCAVALTGLFMKYGVTKVDQDVVYKCAGVMSLYQHQKSVDLARKKQGWGKKNRAKRNGTEI